ncbi:T9SS type A sorting domain-containing protein [Flavobacterium sufflavum]|uniref:T9SS type A sorting domain-containing protein n=1 Tax=Flavobacterium sufflavum TaxID=1921138 RepID=A0A3S2U455_9FLAO|nr:T9SS type A sorting domain-containing protein [Flavobacterium sufflavum]
MNRFGLLIKPFKFKKLAVTAQSGNFNKYNVAAINNTSITKVKNEEESLSANETNNKISDIEIFPNPAKEFAKVNVISSDIGIKYIRVFDLNGREIANYKANNATNFSITTSNLNIGLYLVKITANNDTVAIKKLLINR